MIAREITSKLQKLAATFKVVALTGARQVGKTTLVRHVFPEKPYISLENPDQRQFADSDPRGFLNSWPEGAIFDEVQRVPHLFSYLQEIVDNNPAKGQYILTGSNNFLLNQAIAQSLAGRVGYLVLHPFSSNELAKAKQLPSSHNAWLLNGGYPPIYDQQIPPEDWYPNYIHTYVERDVRQIKNITDLIVFERFIALLAGRCGQELNISALSTEAGIDAKTVQSWIGVLESSFIIYLLRPYYRNFNKTVVKRPKLFFYDTGLACSLLRIKQEDHLHAHPLRGALFENMVVMELLKNQSIDYNQPNLYYWRDKTGHEIDVVIEYGDQALPIEIKSGQTIQPSFFKNLLYWQKISGTERGIVLYGGDQSQKRSNGLEALPWRNFLSARQLDS